MTRPDIFFAVTVPPDFSQSQTGRRIHRRYRMAVWLVATLAVFVMWAAIQSGWDAGLGLVFVLQIAGGTIAFVRCNGAIRPYAAQPALVREASLAARREPLPGGWAGVTIPFVILAFTAIYTYLRWNLLPDKYPVHWGLSGQPDRWVAKGIGTVFGPLLMGAIIIMAMLIIARMIANSRRVAVEGEAAERDLQYRRINLLLLLGSMYFIAVVYSATVLRVVLTPEDGSLPGLSYLRFAILLPIFLLIFILVRFSKRYGFGRGKTEVIGDRTPDAAWHLGGMFYFNPDDPAVLVEKRFGFGYTFNMARPVAWLLLGLLLAAPLLVVAVK